MRYSRRDESNIGFLRTRFSQTTLGMRLMLMFSACGVLHGGPRNACSHNVPTGPCFLFTADLRTPTVTRSQQVRVFCSLRTSERLPSQGPNRSVFSVHCERLHLRTPTVTRSQQVRVFCSLRTSERLPSQGPNRSVFSVHCGPRNAYRHKVPTGPCFLFTEDLGTPTVTRSQQVRVFCSLRTSERLPSQGPNRSVFSVHGGPRNAYRHKVPTGLCFLFMEDLGTPTVTRSQQVCVFCSLRTSERLPSQGPNRSVFSVHCGPQNAYRHKVPTGPCFLFTEDVRTPAVTKSQQSVFPVPRPSVYPELQPWVIVGSSHTATTAIGCFFTIHLGQYVVTTAGGMDAHTLPRLQSQGY